jgi:glycosyltransferase involved in cell wall biosynthesis
MNILFLQFGKFSNINEHLIHSFRNRAINVIPIDVSDSINPRAFMKESLVNLAISALQFGRRWKIGYEQTLFAFNAMSRYCDRIMKSQSFDIVFQTQSIFSAGLQKPDRPYYIYTDHTHFLSIRAKDLYRDATAIQASRKWLEAERNAYERCDTIFTVSEYVRNSVIKDYSISSDKVITAYPGINIDANTLNSTRYDTDCILFVGIDFNRKGGPILLEAFKKVKNIIPNVRLVIIGCDIKVNDPQVIVKGKLPLEFMAREYQNASLFVLPSLREPFGIAFLEAMACGLPCIGTSIESIPEIINDGLTGFLVKPNNSDDLAEKICRLLTDKKLLREMGENAKHKAKTHTWERTTKDILRNVMIGR